MDFWIGALIGGVAGLIGVIIVYFARTQKFNSIMKTVTDPGVQYSAPFYFASAGRYQKSLKIYDSYGAIYLIGNTVYYKSSVSAAPWAFDLSACKLQQEPNWRRLKWFSFTTTTGEKYYFDSYKMGFFANNSDETLKALSLFQSRQTSQPSQTSQPHQPPPLPRA
jgi:hypothetical protein